jgi:hypothetical protein
MSQVKPCSTPLPDPLRLLLLSDGRRFVPGTEGLLNGARSWSEGTGISQTTSRSLPLPDPLLPPRLSSWPWRCFQPGAERPVTGTSSWPEGTGISQSASGSAGPPALPLLLSAPTAGAGAGNMTTPNSPLDGPTMLSESGSGAGTVSAAGSCDISGSHISRDGVISPGATPSGASGGRAGLSGGAGGGAPSNPVASLPGFVESLGSVAGGMEGRCVGREPASDAGAAPARREDMSGIKNGTLSGNVQEGVGVPVLNPYTKSASLPPLALTMAQSMRSEFGLKMLTGVDVKASEVSMSGSTSLQ